MLASPADCLSSMNAHRDVRVEHDITCKQLIGALADFLAGELGADEESRCRLHLGACADCARYLEDYQATIRLIRDAE